MAVPHDVQSYALREAQLAKLNSINPDAPLSEKDKKTVYSCASELSAMWEALPASKREFSAKEIASMKKRINAHDKKRAAAFPKF
jgi:hypothetical protein